MKAKTQKHPPGAGMSNIRSSDSHPQEYYATDPEAARKLLQVEKLNHRIWEPACGGGHLAREFTAAGHDVVASDMHDWGYGITGSDFLNAESRVENCPKRLAFNAGKLQCDIVTNPPFSLAAEFAWMGNRLLNPGQKMCLFELVFLESGKRRELFLAYPPARIWVFSDRIKCARNGEFDKYPASAVAYCWIVWECGNTAPPVLGWI